MTIHVCDRCGCKLDPMNIHELDFDDVLYDTENQQENGIAYAYGKELCEECYEFRVFLHTQLDIKFFEQCKFDFLTDEEVSE